MVSQLPHRPAVYEPTERIDVNAWADEAADALSTVQITPSKSTRGTSVSLAIPLDEHPPRQQHVATDGEAAAGERPTTPRRREPLRRDSMKRREALLKGNEGSRRRQRWENDRLLSNPWAQPPLPSDWEVRPTHTVRQVPYFLAPLWDASVAARREEEQRRRASKAKRGPRPEDEEIKVGAVPEKLREKMKRTKAAKGLLMDLEEQIRQFVVGWEEKQNELHNDGLEDADSEEEELVFVGRNGKMHDMPPSPTSKRRDDLRKEKLVFDSLADDNAASFGRWLVHSIATYYGLRTWSITTGTPARREAYVGIRPITKAGRDHSAGFAQLPRPLWGMV